MKIKNENEITKKKGRREALKRMANLMIGALGVAAFPRISSSNDCIKHTNIKYSNSYDSYSIYSDYNDVSGYNRYGSIVYLKRS